MKKKLTEQSTRSIVTTGFSQVFIAAFLSGSDDDGPQLLPLNERCRTVRQDVRELNTVEDGLFVWSFVGLFWSCVPVCDLFLYLLRVNPNLTCRKKKICKKRNRSHRG